MEVHCVMETHSFNHNNHNPITLMNRLINEYALSSLDEGEFYDEEKGLVIQSLCFVKV